MVYTKFVPLKFASKLMIPKRYFCVKHYLVSFLLLRLLREVFSGWLALGAIAGVKGASRSCRKAAMSSGMVDPSSVCCHYL